MGRDIIGFIVCFLRKFKKNNDCLLHGKKCLTIERKVKLMNKYNRTNFEYVPGRCYDDKMSVGGAFLKTGLGGGFHGVLLDYIEQFRSGNEKKIVLIAESTEAAKQLHKVFDWAEISNLVDYSDKRRGSDYDLDLNIKQNFKGGYDIILSQALLEHVCNPFMAIENFVDLLNNDGLIVLHTHNYKMPYHAYPIDCIRFYRDWFYDLPNYLPIKIVQFLEADVHLFCVYKKIREQT
jgi:hypothetical protein